MNQNFNGDTKIQQNVIIQNFHFHFNKEAQTAIKPAKKKKKFWGWVKWLIGLIISILPFNSS